MTKEQLAEIMLKNYIELAQAINPNIKNNDEELLAYFETLQQQIILEINKMGIKSIDDENNEKVADKEEVIRNEVDTVIQQENSQIIADTPMSSDNNKLQDETFVYPNDTMKFESNEPQPAMLNDIPPITPPTPIPSTEMPMTTPAMQSTEQEELELDEELDLNYIEEMANMFLEKGELRTVAPIPERYGIAIAKRVEEIQKAQAGELDNMFNDDQNYVETTGTMKR